MTLTYSDAMSGVKEVRYSNDSITWTPWEDASDMKAWVVPIGDGSKIVYYEVKDISERISQFSDTIGLDTVNPSGSILINDDALWTNTTSVILMLTYSDGMSGVKEVRYSNDSIIWTAWEDANDMKAWVVPIGDGSKIVYYEIKDISERISQFSDIIGLDTILPSIDIKFPLHLQYFDTNAPSFNVEIRDTNLDEMWYTLNTDTFKNFFISNESIDQNLWNEFSDEEITIIFHAKDLSGNLKSSSIIVYKDTKSPLITVNSPANLTLWNIPPRINITAYDPTLENIAYTLHGYDSFYIPLENNTEQELNLTLWNLLPQGIFKICIYAKDQFEHYSNINLTLYKDILDPEITIRSPIYNQIFGFNAPNFNVNITDDYLNKTWYCLSDDRILWSPNFTFTGNYGLINQSVWDTFENGTLFIRFFASDKAGNIASSEIKLSKDIYAPIITITTPSFDDIFGYTPPNFSIYKSAPNINTTWYSLGNDQTKYIFTDIIGTINQSAWENCEPGYVLIIFYINDSLNNIGFDSILVIKDIYIPTINIIQPFDDSILDLPPPLHISVYDTYLDSIWYEVGNETIPLPNHEVTILNASVWEKLPQGDFKLYFFAKDKAGNVNNKYVLLKKDTLAPNISINKPFYNQEFGEDSPHFELSITENNLHTSWYTIDAGKTNKTFTGTVGKINQTLWEALWNSLPEGSSITIRFYANDSLGHLGYNEVKVLKESESSDKEKIEEEKPFDVVDTLTSNRDIIVAGLGIGVVGVTLGISNTQKYAFVGNKKEKRKIGKIIALCLLLVSLIILSALI